MKIALLQRGFDVAPLLAALDAHPELWNQNPGRTADPTSPHYLLDDIWCRYAAPGVDGAKPHASVWYESAITAPLRAMAVKLFELVGGDALGGVLVTRIPAGAMCRPHIDEGWHAREYEKVAVQVAAAPSQAFCFDGESLVTAPGDVYYFNNAHRHWVTNDGPHARVTAIFCIRTRYFDALKERPTMPTKNTEQDREPVLAAA